MKKRHLWLTVICLIISIFTCFCLAACNGCNGCGDGGEEPAPVRLPVPDVSVDGAGKATWGEVANASGYAYIVDSGTEQTAPANREVQLNDGEAIKVKAVGDGVSYADSDYCLAVRYTAQQIVTPSALAAPTVTLDGGTASWGKVPDADGYVYQIRQKAATVWGADTDTAATSVENLTEGQSLRVKAVSGSDSFTDSAWSNTVTVPVSGTVTPEPPGPVNPDKPGTPQVFVDGDGYVSWTEISGADWYAVEIDGADAGITVNNYYSKNLTDGQTVRVRAVAGGNSADDDAYGEWSEPYTYEKPAVDLPNGIKFVFGADKTSTNAYTASDLTKVFGGACENAAGFGAVTATSNVFQGYNSSEPEPLKFGSSKSGGTVTLSFKKEVVMAIVCCKKYGSDKASLSVADAAAQSLEAEQKDFIYTLPTPSESVKIQSENRCVIYCITVFFEMPVTLEKPEVKIDPYGVATWEAVANASGYTCSVNGGAAQTANGLRVELKNNDRITVTAVGDGINYLSSVSDEATYTETHYALDKPEVIISRGTAYWNIDKNASGYVYRINGGDEKPAPADGGVPLENGQTIEVKALGDSIFTESGWSDAVTFNIPGEPAALGVPAVTVGRDGTVSWTNNPADYPADVSGYGVAVNGVPVTGGTVRLNGGETVTVIARGDGVYFTDSAAAELTYTAPANAFAAPENLTVEIEGADRGVVIISWDAVENAGGYAYIINENYENAVITTDAAARVDLSEIDATKLGDTWFFRVMTLGDGNDEIAPDGDYSDRYEASAYCGIAEFRVERGGDEKVYSVSEINKVINYFGRKNLPDDTFNISGTVSANTAYGESIGITLTEGEAALTLDGAVMDGGFSETRENLLKDFTVTATGRLAVTVTGGVEERKLVNSVAEVKFESLADRYALAVATLQGMNVLQFGAEVSESFTLPMALYGVNVMWTVDTTDDKAFVLDGETGIVTVTLPRAEDGEALAELKADLYYGDLNDDDVDIYEPADKNELTFDIVVPAIEKRQLDAPKISIDAKTGVATWTEVEDAIGYYVNYYGFVDNDYNSEYINVELYLEPGDERAVQLKNKLNIAVIALGDDIYRTDSDRAYKQYTYYPETVTPDGTPLTFDLTKLTQTGTLSNATYIFGLACGNDSVFTGATASRVELGNSDGNGAVTGTGFIKVGSATADGTVTLNFGKKINGVVITACQWSNDDNDKVSVNGSGQQTASKNGWGEMTFNFTATNAAAAVTISTDNRVFIKKIVVYVQD